MLHVHVSASFAKYGPYLGIKRGFVRATGLFFLFAMLCLSALCYDFFPSFMDLYAHCLRRITSVDVRN